MSVWVPIYSLVRAALFTKCDSESTNIWIISHKVKGVRNLVEGLWTSSLASQSIQPRRVKGASAPFNLSHPCGCSFRGDMQMHTLKAAQGFCMNFILVHTVKVNRQLKVQFSTKFSFGIFIFTIWKLKQEKALSIDKHSISLTLKGIHCRVAGGWGVGLNAWVLRNTWYCFQGLALAQLRKEKYVKCFKVTVVGMKLNPQVNIKAVAVKLLWPPNALSLSAVVSHQSCFLSISTYNRSTP